MYVGAADTASSNLEDEFPRTRLAGIVDRLK